VFTPRKFQAKQLAGIGGDLWGYLRGGREQADYYLGPDGTPSEAAAALHGRLWARLGLARLDRVAFARLAAGCHPVTGERLVKTSYTTRLDPITGQRISAGGFRVPGIDCNLSPPKSVSALLPFVSHQERAALERAHLAAVRVTLQELERRVAACRPTVNGEQIHTPGELGVAVFTHHTSRPTKEVAAEPGRPPDPQLHSHAFIFNLAWCQGRWLAVDSRPIYQFATTAEAIYACQLAAELQRLGYRLAWHQTHRGRAWELQGVDRRLLELFSSRHRQLERAVADFQARRRRPPTLRERCRLAARDRAAKTGACRAPHWPGYRAVLQRHGLQAPTVQRHRQELAPLAEREAVVRARLLAPDGLTGQDATVDQAALTRAVYQAAAGLLDATEASGFLERLLAGPDLVPVATPDGPRYTTRTLLAQERQIVRVARTKAHTRHLGPTTAILANAIQLTSLGGVRLSQEQRAALEHLAAPVGWASLLGHAGTGKTTLLCTLVRAYRANFQPVVLVSTAAETARRTARDLDLERGWTVEAFTRAVKAGQLQPREDWVVLVEEAAMMDTQRMAALLEAAGPAAIRTLGDPEQAQPVGAGGWHQLVDQAIGGHVQLTTVIRQRHEADRAVCAAIRDGHAHQALASLQGRGRVHLSPDRSSAIKELVHAWDRHRRRRGLDGVRIVTDTDNHTVDVLNALCQATRRAAGELDGPSVTVIDRVTGRGEQVHARDRVRFTRTFIAGDLLGSYVANGTGGQVLAVDPGDGVVTIECDDRRTVSLRPAEFEEGAQPLRLGYAGHALKLQGGQAEVVLVLPGGWQTSRQSAYSMATRCVEELHVFLDAATQQTGLHRDDDPVAALAERWTRDAKKQAATSQLDRGEALDRPRGEPSGVDDELVVASPEFGEPGPAVWAKEPTRSRDLTDGLGLDQ
jgi:conjugative relaxase-like TrwC/TraI family protein